VRTGQIISIKALYPFNVWTDDLTSSVTGLAEYFQSRRAEALAMCPLNTGDTVPLDAAAEGGRPSSPSSTTTI
jgi:2-keto-myo-inositol isomerase